jgi:hypothetical protein
MRDIHLHRSGVVIALVIGLAAAVFSALDPLWHGSAFAATPAGTRAIPAAQTNREGAVTVKITPRNLAPDAASWEFEIILDTHTQALNQDMSRSAVLIDAAGKSHPAVGWEGDPPGAHHRRGVLRFKPLPGKQAAVELRVTGIGGVEVRKFRWQLE